MPEPIRKRAYHRALKRGAPWALVKKGMHDICRELTKQMFSTGNAEEMTGLRKYILTVCADPSGPEQDEGGK